MKYLTIIVLSVLFLSNAFCGDDPCNATLLDTSLKGKVTFDNSSNTDSGIDAPPYGDYSGPDTWLSFVMPAGGELPMYLRGGTMDNPAIAIYSGDCNNLKLLYNVIDHNCVDDLEDNDNFPAIFFDELIPGQTYFIRVWAESGSNDGTFDISFDTSIDVPKFLTYADAEQIGDDCYKLTEEVDGQHGCAWYEKPIDFSNPFTHKMTANFGDRQCSSNFDYGADGICLIYQTNGPDYCGGTGSGIGAGGMPNSFIIEFDTYLNPYLSDPGSGPCDVDDHSSVNINGNMNHNASINGPVNIGEVEDGNYHDIEFTWNPSTNDYTVSFDGNVIMSGSYDIINNVFGGETNVWWGYTASTGAASNEQIICPVIPDPLVLGTQEYLEDTICEGEDFHGFTEDGFYIEYVNGDPCNHQLNIALKVIPESEPYVIDTLMCANDEIYFKGETYFDPGTYQFDTLTKYGCDSIIILNIDTVGMGIDIIDTVMCAYDELYFKGETYFEPGTYQFDTLTKYGCDSIIILNIDTIGIGIDIEASDSFNCKVDSVRLTGIVVGDSYDLSYNWQGQNTQGYDDTFDIFQSGTYKLTVGFEENGLTCFITDSIVINADTTAPAIPDIENHTFYCDQNIPVLDFSIDTTHDGYSYKWYHDNKAISDSNSLHTNMIGNYFVEVYDSLNGCTSVDSFSIDLIGDIPDISVLNDTLTCLKTKISPQIQKSNDITDYIWFHNDDSISNLANPVFDSSGSYKVIAANATGCIDSAKFEIYLNNKKPVVNYLNDTIPCNKDSILIRPLDINPDYSFNFKWNTPSDKSVYGMNLHISEAGNYKLTVTDPSNGCTFEDTISVFDKGNSPVADFYPKTLTCKNTGYYINLTVDSSNAIFKWELDNQFFSDSKNPYIDSPGKYIVELTSQNGCTNIYSFEVSMNIDTIPLQIEKPDTLTCDISSITLKPIANSGIDLLWTGPNGFTSSETNPEVTEPGKYELSVVNPENGCQSFASVIVDFEGQLPEFSIIGDTLDCSTKSVELDIVSTQDYQNIKWIGPNNFIATNTTKIEVGNPGLYKATVINELGCKKTLEFNVIDTTLFPELMLISPEYFDYKLGESYDILTEIEADEENIANIHWKPSKYLSCDDCLNPTFTSDEEENIDYTLIITNKQGCSDSVQVHARFIKEIPPVIITAPNIIIGDNNNISNHNIFTIYGHPVELIQEIKTLQIFNRWGELVFEKHRLTINDYLQGWDGTFKGRKATVGVYVYYSEVLLKSGKIVKLYGDVTLIR